MTYTNIINKDIENAKAAKTLEEKVTAKRQLKNDLFAVYEAYNETLDQALNDLFFEGAAVHSKLLTQEELISVCKSRGLTIAGFCANLFNNTVAKNCTEESVRVFKASLITDFFAEYKAVHKNVEGGVFQPFYFPDISMLLVKTNGQHVSVEERPSW